MKTVTIYSRSCYFTTIMKKKKKNTNPFYLGRYSHGSSSPSSVPSALYSNFPPPSYRIAVVPDNKSNRGNRKRQVVFSTTIITRSRHRYEREWEMNNNITLRYTTRNRKERLTVCCKSFQGLVFVLDSDSFE